jgi:hypothetical protein
LYSARNEIFAASQLRSSPIMAQNLSALYQGIQSISNGSPITSRERAVRQLLAKIVSDHDQLHGPQLCPEAQ